MFILDRHSFNKYSQSLLCARLVPGPGDSGGEDGMVPVSKQLTAGGTSVRNIRALGSQGSCNKVPQTGWLKQQKFISSQFWKVEMQDQGVCSAGFILRLLLGL